VQSLIAQGAPQAAITQAQNDEIGALERLKTQYPQLRDQIDIYIATIRSIPPTAGTTLELQGASEFIRQLQSINTLIQQIPPEKVVNIPGIGGAPHDTGGAIAAGTFGTVAEKRREILVFAGGQQVLVEPNGRTEQILANQGGFDEARLVQLLVAEIARLRPNEITLNEVSQDPAANAFAITSRLGMAATR
jgi:hypothetical protein